MHDDDRDELIARIADELREPVALDPAFDERVMAHVRRASSARWRHAFRWWTEPKPLRVSPLAGLAWAAGLGAVVLLADRALEQHPAPIAPTPTAPSVAVGGQPALDTGNEVVQFVLVAPQASTVALVGDFNGWDPSLTQLHPAPAGGVWSVNVALSPGQHQYAFVVDGKEWRPDPASPHAVTDDFGAPNSVIVVGGKRT